MLWPVEDTVLFFHLLGVLLFVAGIVLAGVAFEAARRRELPADVALLLGMARIGAVLVVSGGLLLLVCGLWLVDLGDDGLGTAWVDAAIALFALVMLLGGLGGQRPKRARMLATQLAREGGQLDADLRALLDDPVSRVANYASAALVPMILALMVFQP